MSEQGQIHQHSGWLIPLGLLLTLLALSGLMLLYYLRPLPDTFRDIQPTTAANHVGLSLAGIKLSVPANFLEGRRGGGNVEVVPLFARLPAMTGFSNAEAAVFRGNAADSPIVHMLVRGDVGGPNPADRFERIYKPYLRDPSGIASPFGLTLYQFRPDSGYGRDDLFVSRNGGTLLLLCEQPAQDLPSPNCLAIDRPIARNVSLSYRFKRSQLAQWQSINDGVGRLVESFIRR